MILSTIKTTLRIYNAAETGANKIFYLPLIGGTSFADHLCYLCLVVDMLSRLFIAALWSPAGKGLTS